MIPRTAGRASNARRSLARGAWIFLLALHGIGLLAQLPPGVQADRYTLQAQSAIEDQDYVRARAALEKILELQARHSISIPLEFHFFYADVLDRTGDLESALDSVERYLAQTGREGDNYMAALKLLNRLETSIEERRQAERERLARLARERAERERSAQAERERSARAERERLAVAATRQTASRELPSEIKGIEFIRIPAGVFRMGSNRQESDFHERPVSRVRISQAFEIGKYEVTQSEWSAVMGENPSVASACGQCPVDNVSWDDLQEFIGILNQAVGRTTPDIIYRLPTEAEWEYAARAGTTGERYSSDLSAVAWHAGNSGGRSHAVGGKRANAWGLHDMLGNVWEWTQDWYGPYEGGGKTDPAGPRTGSYRVVRGGGWASGVRDCRAAYRLDYAPANYSEGIGFRLARTVR